MASNIDAAGYYIDGRFAGKHVDTIAAYAESLETAATKEPGGSQEGTPSGAGAGVSEMTPAQRLAAHASGRVDAATLLTASRFRTDDEADFKAKIGPEEFTKVGAQVLKLVEGLHPQQQMQKGIHWMVYVQLKATDPEFEKRILGSGKPEASVTPEGETEEEKTAREEAEAATATEAAEQAATRESERLLREAPKGPKATPATVRATPGAKTSGSKERKPKLIANDKIIRAAREWGIPVEEYLLKLEDGGTTQEGLEAQSRPRSETRRRTVFDRPSAG